MTQVRRVLPRKGMLKTQRPNARCTISAETLRARKAVVVPLFPHDEALTEAGPHEVNNIFTEIGPVRPADDRVARARTRARSRLPLQNIPQIENLFAEDCPDVADEVLETSVSVFRSTHRRPLEAARKEIEAYHDEHAHSTFGEVLHLPWPRVAASLFGMFSLIHFTGSQVL